MIKKCLIFVRFFIPLLTVFFRVGFTSERYHHANLLACQYLNNHSSLISALSKVEKIHIENKQKFSEMYTANVLDEIRSRSYLFPTADYNYSHTFLNVWVFQLASIEQQIDFLMGNENLKIKCDIWLNDRIGANANYNPLSSL